MKVICCVCGLHLKDTPSGVLDAVSHGMCDPCAHIFMAQVGMSLPEYLEGLPEPVVTVTSEGTINTANSKALSILGKTPGKIQGLPGGDVFACEYASLPEGCGKTIHCSACTIRNTVMDTMKTGKPNVRKPAFLQQASEDGTQKLELLITTEKKGGVVFLKIDELAPSAA